MEQWKDIVGFEGLYQIGSHGEIKSINYNRSGKPRILKGGLSKGYKSALLCNKATRKQLKIHRLVAQAFIPNPNSYPVVMHIDNNIYNNNVSNLKWGTQKENVNQCHDELRASFLFGSKNPNAKGVIQYDLCNNIINSFGSIMDAQRKTLVYNTSICDCCRGRQKTAGGYIWRYV